MKQKSTRDEVVAVDKATQSGARRESMPIKATDRLVVATNAPARLLSPLSAMQVA